MFIQKIQIGLRVELLSNETDDVSRELSLQILNTYIDDI